MLKNVALYLGEDVTLWTATGLVHDLDYLQFPHHELQIGSEDAHPMKIARWLYDNNAPAVMALAVLEHSPHLGLEPSSRLSHAVIVCDEHATMTGNNQRPEYPADINQDLLNCLDSPVSAVITGFVRDDMDIRAVASLRALGLRK